MANYTLEMIDITKEFPGVKALDQVNFRVKKGEIHALVGENGAGKSTLMKILSGVYPYGSYTGKILINGEEEKFHNIKESEHNGITIIYQELAHVKYLSVAENIFLGNEIANKGIVNWDQTYLESKKVLQEVNININPAEKLINLGVSQQQLVEIAKAISKKSDILILDEPTAALNEEEIENLFIVLKRLKDRGVTCIYISHKISEIFKIADRVTILRDGKNIHTDEIKNLNENQIISMMVGRELKQRFPNRNNFPGEIIFEVKNWSIEQPEKHDRKKINNVSFNLRKGEILGIAGLMGSGRTELALSLIGAYGRKVSGEMILEDSVLTINNPYDAINNGISYLTEDRKTNGMVEIMEVKKNITLSSLNIISDRGIISQNKEIKESKEYVEKLRIKTPSIEQIVRNLSGGNQQKVILAKCLMINPRVLILDEPTRGIDVGAKYEIHCIMNELTNRGISIIMISSELPEILGMSDRILVMAEGKITGDLIREKATQEKILLHATGRN
jgi:ABC-type sugar transport system ATPase subunit